MPGALGAVVQVCKCPLAAQPERRIEHALPVKISPDSARQLLNSVELSEYGLKKRIAVDFDGNQRLRLGIRYRCTFGSRPGVVKILDRLTEHAGYHGSPIEAGQEISGLIIIYPAHVSTRKSPAHLGTHDVMTFEPVIRVFVPSA
jgi:hypothetical protein